LTKRIVDKPYVFHKILTAEDKRLAMVKHWKTRRLNKTDKHSKTTIQKLSEITAMKIANGEINRISKIEYIVADKLKLLNIKFIHQYAIRDASTGRFCACVDFYLPDHNIAIEVNGTFWHADPRIYPNRNTLKPSQIRTLTKYSNKITVLKRLNIHLIEIWEFDITKNPDHFIDPFMSALGY